MCYLFVLLLHALRRAKKPLKNQTHYACDNKANGSNTEYRKKDRGGVGRSLCGMRYAFDFNGMS